MYVSDACMQFQQLPGNKMQTKFSGKRLAVLNLSTHHNLILTNCML